MISDQEVERLVDAARGARDHSYSPYSTFRVGAAVLAGGNLYIGANIENASYPLSVCAECNAVAAAVIAGDRDIVAVAVATDEDEPTPPCGACRQVLNEFGPTMRVISEGVNGKRGDWPLPELLPNAFGPEDLGVERP